MRTEDKVKIYLFTVFVTESSALSMALYISAQLLVVMSCAQRR
jgi:hypothetical protein